MDLNQAKRQLKNLSYVKDDPIALEKAAKKIVQMGDKDLDVQNMFIDKEEKKLAKSLLKKYLSDFSIENISDKNTLKQLIYLEVIQIRLQNTVNKYKTDKSVPINYLREIRDNLDKIIQLKDKLGLNKEKQEKTSGLEAFELLKKKIKIWSKNNPSRAKICYHCGKMVLFKMRSKVWDVQKYPFFPYDRVLGNKHLISLYKSNKLSKKDVALVLETSEDYIDWLVKKWEEVKDE